MLKIQNLTITYRRDGRVLADHFDLVLNSLDKAVLIGEEGNGKSTLLKWIHDPALIEDYADAEGICLKEKERPAGCLSSCRRKTLTKQFMNILWKNRSSRSAARRNWADWRLPSIFPVIFSIPTR